MNLPPGPSEETATVRDPRAGLLGVWALIATQFQGAFSDNAMKWLVSFLVLESGVSREQRDSLFVLVVPGVCRSFPGVLDSRRLFCRSIQQAERDGLDEAARTGHDGLRDLRVLGKPGGPGHGGAFFICAQEAIFGPGSGKTRCCGWR